uniref:Uncharacterized protein n=1 Tax=Arundo donax TaxID=35708 RepID=A0A0A8ZDV6_ARUDO
MGICKITQSCWPSSFLLQFLNLSWCFPLTPDLVHRSDSSSGSAKHTDPCAGEWHCLHKCGASAPISCSIIISCRVSPLCSVGATRCPMLCTGPYTVNSERESIVPLFFFFNLQAPVAASRRLGKPLVGAGTGAVGAAAAYCSSSSAHSISSAQTWLHKRIGWGSVDLSGGRSMGAERG